jgi:hypothetical protein
VKISQSKFKSILEEYDCAVIDVQGATYNNFDNLLRNFIKMINENTFISNIINSNLPIVHFDEWYEDAKKTVKGMVGSGTLEWPLVREQKLSMQKGLLELIASGKENVLNVCNKFMYAASRGDDCVAKFNEQIFNPFSRDLRRLIQNSSDLEISVAATPQSAHALTLKERIENHPVIWLLGVLAIGFISGFGAYKAILEVSRQSTKPIVIQGDEALDRHIVNQIQVLTDSYNKRLDKLQDHLGYEEKEATSHLNVESDQRNHASAAERIRKSMREENESYVNNLKALKDLQIKSKQ